MDTNLRSSTEALKVLTLAVIGVAELAVTSVAWQSAPTYGQVEQCVQLVVEGGSV